MFVVFLGFRLLFAQSEMKIQNNRNRARKYTENVTFDKPPMLMTVMIIDDDGGHRKSKTETITHISLIKKCKWKEKKQCV